MPVITRLKVLDPGLYTLVVDYGRPRSRSLGVPLGGAADRVSLALGNALVGNPPDASALEFSLRGPILQADGECAAVVYGAPFELASDRQRLNAGTTFTLHPGEQLRIGGTAEGMRAYLCVRGGFTQKTILGSRSALGPVQVGEELLCPRGCIHARFASPKLTWDQEPRLLRVLLGAQAEWFCEEEFYGQEFTVTPASNRMGLRLRGRPLSLPPRELVSEPVCPGAVQVTRDGQCIVLGVDGQTIGGYPKVAQVITADIDKLGQLRPGEVVRFVLVGMQAAEQAYRRKQAELREWIIRLRTAEVFGW